MVVTITEAKTQLSRLLREVAKGRDVVIARDGMPLARLVPSSSQPAQRVPEMAKGILTTSKDWDSAETNAAIAALLAGGGADTGHKPRRRAPKEKR